MDQIKNQILSPTEETLLREKFLNEYAKAKGWDVSKLNTQQLLEITTQKGYQTPGLILG